ncbi:oligosaccharide flippase family protein [Amphritea sp.]|uniref:oligosaccharide flippase family protein n=1 Tax=Amphritea sp. TaxID=1872502 RepID=UPI0025C1C9B8|nr:oligosaccharide flippase family protein [Amphritea sp.]
MSIIKNGSSIALSQGVVALSSLVRNIIIARIISPENFGVASLFALLITFLEMMSGMSIERQIVQCRVEGLKDFIGTVHLLEIVRGCLLSLGIFLVADLYASWFNLSDLGWAFKMLAIVPLLKGFINWDIAKQQRDMLFVNTALVDSIPQIITVLISYPLAIYFNDYRVVLYILIFQVFINVTLTHILSKQRYYISLNFNCIKRVFGFGWPLLLNGFLIFLVFQTDRMIIGKVFSLEMLGYFSAAFAMTIMPSIVIAKIYSIVFLPILSRSQEQGQDEEPYVMLRMLHLTLLTGLYVLSFMILFGGEVYIFAYGSEYFEGKVFMVLLGIMHSIRIIRIGPTIIATSRAQTKVIMKSNVVRSAAVLLSLCWIIMGGGIVGVLVIGIFGEISALYYQVNRINYGSNDAYLKKALNVLISIGVAIGISIYIYSAFFMIVTVIGFLIYLLFCSFCLLVWLYVFDSSVKFKNIF